MDHVLTAATLFEATFALTLWAIIIYGPWQTYCVDAARQTLFELRAELFDMARNGELSFDSTEYQAIRTAFNQYIRFAHRATIWRFVAIFMHLSRHDRLTQKSELTRAIEAIKDDKTREYVRKLSIAGTRAILNMMAARGPAFLLVLRLFKTVQFCRSTFNLESKTLNRISSTVDNSIQIEAELACPA